MKKFSSILTVKVVIFLLVATTIAFSFKKYHEKFSEKISFLKDDDENEEQGKDMYDEAAAAQQFEFERTKDPALGYVPKERLMAAYDMAEQSKQLAMRSRITTASWVERGPTSDVVGVTNGNLRFGGSSSISSGRIKAIWVDLADATGNTVWVGGIGGGLWKTTNFKTNPTSWVPVNDFFTNMSIGSICQDPSNTNIMYFGTGERTNNIDAIRGAGVWKSTDHGVNWSLLSNTSTYYNVSKVLCDASGNLYVGTIAASGGTGGLFRSTNNGTSFTTISATGVDAKVADFVISSTGRLHVCYGYRSASPGYRYTDIPATVASNSWTSGTGFPSTSATNQNCVIACNGNTLYAVPCNSSNAVSAIYKSLDGGANWTATTTAPSNTGNYGFSSNQAWYCLGVDINPADANNVVIGSLNCYGTTDGGNNWVQLSDWSSNYSGAATGQYVHADQQIIKWFAADELLVGSDGGIFYSADAGSSYEDRNTGLNIKQFYSCDFHPTLTDYFLAGAQDNGCHQFVSPGINTTTEITGGDGAIVHIDQDETNYQFGAYVYNRYRRTNDSWGSVGGFASVNFYRSGTVGSPVDFGSFINPTEYDNTANIMYSGSNAGEFFRWTTAQTTAAGSYFFTSGSPAFPTGANVLSVSNMTGTVSSIKISPYTSNRIYLGTNNSKIFKIDNANTFTGGSAGTDITGASFPAGATISCITTGNNDNNLMACFSNYGVMNIWVSADGGTNWTGIDGNLPDMPVRWAVFDPTSNTKAWIATETGVWSTTAINGASTVWTASPGFPTVRTDMIKYRSYDQTLIAATHGRGLWTQSSAVVLPINNFVLKGKWKTNSTVELSWDYSNTNSASFEIESSGNGTYFTKAGASQISTTYLDQPASVDIYYRIKSKNIFGNIGYSNVIHLQKGVDTKDITRVKIFPNPVRNNMKLAFASSGSGVAHYQVTSSNGQVCWKKDEDISANGEYIREWDMQALRPGTYLFTIVYNNKKISQKFSKL
ncbi:MAG TPA: T9SS type A sorting domain-containing protein [Chitinophagaceae bacterium]